MTHHPHRDENGNLRPFNVHPGKPEVIAAIKEWVEAEHVQLIAYRTHADLIEHVRARVANGRFTAHEISCALRDAGYRVEWPYPHVYKIVFDPTWMDSSDAAA